MRLLAFAFVMVAAFAVAIFCSAVALVMDLTGTEVWP